MWADRERRGGRVGWRLGEKGDPFLSLLFGMMQKGEMEREVESTPSCSPDPSPRMEGGMDRGLGGSVSSHGAALKEFAGLQGTPRTHGVGWRSLAPPRNWPVLVSQGLG